MPEAEPIADVPRPESEMEELLLVTRAARKSQTPLLDQLRARHPSPPWWVDPARAALWRAHRDRLLALLRDPALPAFSLDDIAKYYYEINPREYWDLGELAGLEVPYGLCWMEHRLARTIHSEIGDQSLAALATGHAGFLAASMERGAYQGEEIPADVDRLLWFEIFLDYQSEQRLEGPHGSWFVALDGAGRVLETPWMQGFHHPRDNEHLRLLQSMLWPALLACSELAVSGLRRPAFL